MPSYDSIKNLIDAVVIDDNVTRIGSYAFAECQRLKSVTISGKVVSIGASAFENCTSLAHMTIPASVTSIEEDAFGNCASLKSLKIWNGDCEIYFSGYYYDDTDTTLGFPGVTAVTCYAGSAVAEYAEEHGYAVNAVFTMDPPKNIKAEATADGIRVTWKKVPGAGAYRVFYKEAGSEKWKAAGDSTGAFTWTKAKSGKTYIFTVRCLDKAGGTYLSGYDKTGSKGLKYIAAPTVKIAPAVGGIKVAWTKVAGASRYTVYYREKGGGWQKIGTTKGASTSYTWTKAVSGKTYAFTVRAADANKKLLSAYKSSNALKYLTAPTVKIASAANGIKVAWTKVTGASRYAVYYREKGGTWQKIGTTPDARTSYTWTKAKSGKTYAFTVRAADANKNLLSGYVSSKALQYIAAPRISSLTASGSNGIKVSWGKVTGAVRYRVFCKTTGGWKTAGDTTSTSFTLKNAKVGVKYTFTVRCISRDGKTYTSAYDTKGKAYVRSVQVKTGMYLIKGGSGVKNRSFFEVEKKSGNTIQFSAWWAGDSIYGLGDVQATLSGNKATFSGIAKGYFTVNGNTITLKVTDSPFSFIPEGTFTYTYYGTYSKWQDSYYREILLMDTAGGVWSRTNGSDMDIRFNSDGTVVWDMGLGRSSSTFKVSGQRLCLGNGDVYDLYADEGGYMTLRAVGNNKTYLDGDYELGEGFYL